MKPIVFVHVMKCGGTSVKAALAQGAGSVFRLDGRSAMRAAGGMLAQEENWRFRKELLTYLLAAGQHDVILGHFRYDDDHAEFLDQAHFVTVLRRPMERFTSLYNYREARENADVKVDGPFEQILQDPHWQAAGRAYVDTFCGDPSLQPGSEEAIEAAIANLGRFAVVGSTEDLAGFGAEVGARAGREIVVPTLNAGTNPVGHDVAGPDELAVLEEICGPDQRVYDAVVGSR